VQQNDDGQTAKTFAECLLLLTEVHLKAEKCRSVAGQPRSGS
jgi:hypothetical protein